MSFIPPCSIPSSSGSANMTPAVDIILFRTNYIISENGQFHARKRSTIYSSLTTFVVVLRDVAKQQWPILVVSGSLSRCFTGSFQERNYFIRLGTNLQRNQNWFRTSREQSISFKAIGIHMGCHAMRWGRMTVTKYSHFQTGSSVEA